MKDVNKLVEELVDLNVKELLEFKKILKDKYGIEPIITVAMPEATKEEVIVKEEKTEFDVYLTKISEVTAEKLNSVKLIKQFTDINLKAAMDLTKSLPVLLKEHVSKVEIEAFRTNLNAFNAEIELK